MCFFKKSPVVPPVPKPVPVLPPIVIINPEPPTVTLPHPEEPKNPLATRANTDVNVILNQWLEIWKVPAPFWDWWKTKIIIKLYDAWDDEMLAMGFHPDTPAGTWESGGLHYLASLAVWFNKGVAAHEESHISYSLLTPKQKDDFDLDFAESLIGDALMVLLDKQNSYMNTSNIEGHAEVYRYLGEQMPEKLKQYYPMLLS